MPVMNIGEVLPQVGRRWRRPKHQFVLTNKAYQIQPFLCAPVLPGETMKQLLVQSRCVSDPIANPLIGWWLEYYFWYVRHRDLDARDLLVRMMLEPGVDLSSLNSAADSRTFHYGGTIDWCRLCLNRVVETYFRDEDDTYTNGLLDAMPMAYAHTANADFWDNLTPDAFMPDIDPNDTSAQALEPQYAAWEYLRAMKMTDMTYEDYLATYGVHVERSDDAHKPELIRYLREWTYPTNTVEPTTGVPSSALSWSIAERADKDRFFREPGFIFGATVCRPKVYYGGQLGAGVGLMNSGMRWLPAIMKDQPETSLVQVPTGTGPFQGITDVGGYWIDLRDLLLYGDQFSNVAINSVNKLNAISLPRADGAARYPQQADLDALFASSTKQQIRQDGVVSLAILGTQQDTT